MADETAVGKLMYQRMYIDIVFMTNFLMDYMLLRLVGKISAS